MAAFRLMRLCCASGCHRGRRLGRFRTRPALSMPMRLRGERAPLQTTRLVRLLASPLAPACIWCMTCRVSRLGRRRVRPRLSIGIGMGGCARLRTRATARRSARLAVATRTAALSLSRGELFLRFRPSDFRTGLRVVYTRAFRRSNLLAAPFRPAATAGFTPGSPICRRTTYGRLSAAIGVHHCLIPWPRPEHCLPAAALIVSLATG